MADENGPDRWETILKILGYLAVAVVLFAVVVLGLIAGACGLFKR